MNQAGGNRRAGAKCHQTSRSEDNSCQDAKTISTQKKSRTGCPMRPFLLERIPDQFVCFSAALVRSCPPALMSSPRPFMVRQAERPVVAMARSRNARRCFIGVQIWQKTNLLSIQEVGLGCLVFESVALSRSVSRNGRNGRKEERKETILPNQTLTIAT